MNMPNFSQQSDGPAPAPDGFRLLKYYLYLQLVVKLAHFIL